MRSRKESELVIGSVSLLLLYNAAQTLSGIVSLAFLCWAIRMTSSPEAVEALRSEPDAHAALESMLNWGLAWAATSLLVRGAAIGSLACLLLRMRYAFWVYAATVAAAFAISLVEDQAAWQTALDPIGLALLVFVLRLDDPRLLRLFRGPRTGSAASRKRRLPARGARKHQPDTRSSDVPRKASSGKRIASRPERSSRRV